MIRSTEKYNYNIRIYLIKKSSEASHKLVSNNVPLLIRLDNYYIKLENYNKNCFMDYMFLKYTWVM